MPECHDCVNYLSPKWRNVPFELTPCAACVLSDEPNHKGRTHVSRDSSDAVTADEALQALPQVSDCSDHRVVKLADFLRQFMSLPSITRDIVAYRFVNPGRPLSVIAARHRITVQAVHSRLKRALERFPVLQEIIDIHSKKTRSHHGVVEQD